LHIFKWYSRTIPHTKLDKSIYFGKFHKLRSFAALSMRLRRLSKYSE